MTEFLISNNQILAVGPFEIVGDKIVSDLVFPLNVLGNWQIVKQEMPEVFNINDYQFAAGEIMLKPVVSIFDREAWKVERATRVASIVVEIEGMPFDGDETSQNRMARAITAMRIAEAETTLWVLADNTSAKVTLEQLSAALVAAGKAQTEIWVL